MKFTVYNLVNYLHGNPVRPEPKVGFSSNNILIGGVIKMRVQNLNINVLITNTLKINHKVFKVK